MDIISRIESLKRDGTRSKIKTMSVLVLFILLLALVIFGASTDWTFQNRVEVLKNTVSFEDVKLAYVLDTLEMESSFDFHVNTKELLECRFTGTFYKGASIEQAIRTLSKSIPFNYSMQNRRTYVIQGKGCKA